MTPEQVTMVQESWEKVVPIADQASTLFYDKLFEMDPDLKDLFPEEMTEQKKKLMDMITVAVKGLSKLDEIVPAVKALGRRHLDYKVEDSHYQTVGGALLWTLEQGLGDDFTPEVKEAWTETYTLLATVMIEASHEPAA